MIQQTGQPLYFFAFFTASKVGKAGLTVTVDVRDPSGALVVSNFAATEVGGGLYRYTLSGGAVTSGGGYTAIFKTSDSTVDAQHVPALQLAGVAGVERLDATISSRSTLDGSGVQAALTSQGLTTGRAANLDNLNAPVASRSSHSAADVWASPTRTLSSFGTLASDAATAAATAVWGALTAGLTAAGSVGKLVADMLSRFSSMTNSSNQFTSNALTNAPAGGGGGGGGGGTSTRRGPFRVTPVSPVGGADGAIECFVDDEFTIVAAMADGEGMASAPVAVGGATVTARCTGAAGVQVADDASAATAYDDGGVVTLAVPAAWTAARGTKQITLLRDGGAGDRQTFGPLVLVVRKR